MMKSLLRLRFRALFAGVAAKGRNIIFHPLNSGITDITDAFDTLVIGVRFHNVSILRFVGMPVGG